MGLLKSGSNNRLALLCEVIYIILLSGSIKRRLLYQNAWSIPVITHRKEAKPAYKQ